MKLSHFILRAVATCILLATLLIQGWCDEPINQQLADAETVYRTDGPAAALPLFEILLTETRSSGDQRAEAMAIGYIGEIYWRLGDYQQADDYLKQSLKMKRADGDRLQEGKTLNMLGLLHWDLGEFAQAQTYFQQGSAIANELGDKRLAGATLNNLSLVHDELGDYYVSLEQYQHVIELYQGTDFPRGVGDTLGNIGGVYLLLGRYREALEFYQQALAISEQLGSPISMSQDFGNIALCYMGLGKIDDALENLDRAIDLAAQSGMQQDEAYWLSERGNALLLKGRYDLGLENHRAALAIYSEIEGKTEWIEALHDIGQLYLQLGDSINAEANFRQSMELAREIGLSRAITSNLLSLGDLEKRQGEFEAAAALYGQGVQRAKESGEMTAWSLGLLRLAAVHRDSKNYAAATDETTRALEIARKTGAPGLVSQSLYAQGELNRLQDRLEPALADFDQVIAMLTTAPDSDLEWQVQYGKGLAMAAAGNGEAAISALENAIRLIEGVREHLLEERYRAGYVQDKYQVYIELVRLQLEAGRQEAAFSTAERLRSRSYLDLIESGMPIDPSKEQQSQAFAMKERIRVLRKALAEENNRDLPQQRQPAISVYSQELLLAEQEYQAFLDDQRRSRKSARQAEIPTYSEVGGSLADDEVLLEYVVGKENVMLFALTRETLRSFTIPIRREDLENKVELVRNLIHRQDNEHWRKPADSLARILMEPVMTSGQLEGIHHIYLVPHGNLNYLPFALLPSPGIENPHRLVEDFTLAYLPTASALLQQTGTSVNISSMLTLAPERSHLKHAAEEALAIDTLFRPDSHSLLGKLATESSFKQLASHYRLLHLATHGYFNKLNPLLSGLELEADADNDGQLELHEILGLQLDAELVTLSACQTGLGSGYFTDMPAGDDFVGLTRAFLYAGSTAVLATLWEVDDASTMALMKLFYGGFRQATGTEDKATALALAQRALLSSDNYRHPYFWAPFVLVGEMSRNPRKQI